jgi:hypothetical protein
MTEYMTMDGEKFYENCIQVAQETGTDMSVNKFCDEAGFSTKQFTRFKRYNRSPTVSQFYDAAEALGVYAFELEMGHVAPWDMTNREGPPKLAVRK